MRFPASFFEGTRPNQGPGFHTDEASSAIESLLKHGLPRADAAVLRGPRENPVGSKEAEDDEKTDDRIMTRGELFEPAMLVTGQWGIDSRELRRQLPVYGGVRENPKTVRDYDPFFVRMQKLEAVLIERRDAAKERYERLGRGSKPWVVALDKALVAVRYVLAQKKVAPQKRTILSGDWFLGLPKKGSWNPISKKGNAKLPFVAYSELPMATCPGALKCRIDYDAYEPGSKGYRGWCYSFGSWMRAAPFLVQFLNTLADYADREFAILANGGSADPREHASRVTAAMKGKRIWMDVIRDMTLAYTQKGRAKAPAFLRLFVDGDVNTEDNIIAWMRVVKEMGSDAGTHGVQVYGYSKCWNQFLNVDTMMGRDFWPENYTLNMSSGSAYEGLPKTREAMKLLPVSRGYFEAIPITGYMKELEAQIEAFRKSPDAVVPMVMAPFRQFEFDPERVRTFLRIQGLQTWREAVAMFPALEERSAEREMDQIRKRAMHVWIDDLVRKPTFGAIVQKELAKDEGKANKDTESAQKRRLQILMREISVPTPPPEKGRTKSKDPYDATIDERKKAFALVLQEVTWTFALGGSCPLVCGNCSDDPTGGTKGVHRCAARPGSAFWHARIHIGIH